MIENDYTVKDTTTIFMLPFYFSDEYFDHVENSDIWEIASDLRIDKSAFYPHIHGFLVDELSEGKMRKPDTNKCIVYSLKDKWENISEENKCIAKLFGNIDFEIKNKSNESGSDKFIFRLLNEKNKLSSPKLILYPLSKVGFLMISIELMGERRTLNDLLSFNNILHKIDQEPEIKIVISENAPEIRKKKTKEIYQSLAKYNQKTNGNIAENWYIYSLFRFLLNLNKKEELGIGLFNKSRFHLFTYLQINSLENFENGIKTEKNELTNELKKDLIRLSGCQNKKYKVLPSDLKDNERYMQTFENIYIASSVEGSCMMVDSHGEDYAFFSDFKNIFLARYLWIYMLVYMQRHTLIELTKRLMNIDMETAIDSKDSLGKYMKNLSKIKTNSFFTDISDHTQHNTFYQFCSDKLMVKNHLKEVTGKIKDADAVLHYEIEQSEKKRDRRLNLFGAVLSTLIILQTFFAVVVFFQKDNEKLLIIIPIVLIMLMWFYIFSKNIKLKRTDSRKKKKYNETA